MQSFAMHSLSAQFSTRIDDICEETGKYYSLVENVQSAEADSNIGFSCAILQTSHCNPVQRTKESYDKVKEVMMTASHEIKTTVKRQELLKLVILKWKI